MKLATKQCNSKLMCLSGFAIIYISLAEKFDASFLLSVKLDRVVTGVENVNDHRVGKCFLIHLLHQPHQSVYVSMNIGRNDC